MKRELSTTDGFEKKKAHVAWFSLVLLAFCISYDGSPIKIPGVEAKLPVRPAILLLTILVMYSTTSFWFESRRIMRLNSHLVAGKEVKDTVAEIRDKLRECEQFLQAILDLDFKPHPVPEIKPYLERVNEHANMYIQTLAIQKSKTKTATEVGELNNLISVINDFKQKLTEFPLGEVDPVLSASKARARTEEAVAGFKINLEQAVIAFTDNLLRLSDDILTEGKVQWSALELWPPLILGSGSIVSGLLLLLFPSFALTLRNAIIG